MTAIIEAAVFLAESWPVFPCGADKRPVTEHGFKDATTDLSAVRSLFHRPGAVLIGVPTGEASDLAVVDLDVKEGASGLEWLAANEHRLPQTRRHRTRSGGIHLLFRYPAGRRIRNSASKIAPGVDVRGEGGYIIAPPSDGYTIASDTMPAPMPAWLVDLLDPPLPAPAPRPVVAREWRDTSAPGSRYGLAALSDETDAICNAPFGQQETTLNAAGLKVGALVAGGEIEAAYARETLIRAGLAMASEPGKPAWSPEEIRRKVERAIADGSRNPRQAPERPQLVRRVTEEFAPPPVPDWVYEQDAGYGEPDAEPAPERAEAPVAKPSVRPLPTLTLDEIEAMPPPVWLIEGLLVQASNASLIAPPKSLKSFLALDWALHIAYGIPWQGRPVKQGGVIYIAGEGVGGMARRIAAWRAFHGCSGNPAPFRLVAVPFRIMSAQHVQAAVATAQAMMEADGVRPLLYVNDTLARSMAGADENSAQDMGQAIEGMDRIRAETQAAMLTVHHTGKDAERGARGSSALLGAVDTEITVKREDSLLRVKVTAQKDAEEGDEIVVRAQKVGIDGREPEDGKPSSLVLMKTDAQLKTDAPALSGGMAFGLKMLREAIAAGGQTAMSPDYPAGVRIVPIKAWRREFYARSHLESDDAKKKAFQRAAKDLAHRGVVGVCNDHVWVARDQHAEN
jgi:hypothetical protein